MVIGISWQDSAVAKSNTFQPLCRIYYSEIDTGLVCIDRIVDIVDRNAHRTSHQIQDGCVEYQVSSTAEDIQKIAVSLQPNPFDQSTLLRFANPHGHTFQLEIRDMQGRLLKSWSDIHSGAQRIDREDLPPGIYLYRLFGATGQATGKMVVR